MSGTLTVSGNEVTDATRAAALLLGTSASGQMIDGRSSDSSFGIRRAATNLFRRGQCDSNVDWGTVAVGVSQVVDATTPAPFSTQSIKYTADGLAASQGAGPQTATGRAAAAGVVIAGSVYFKGVAGQSYLTRIRINNTDASITDGTSTTFTATGAWQLVTPPTLAVAVGKTGDSFQVLVRINGTRAEVFRCAHAMIEQGQAVVAPYVATSGGSTATHNASRVQAPVSLIDETQGWIACRIRMGFAVANEPGGGAGNLKIMDWRDSATEGLLLYYSEGSNIFQMLRRSGGVSVGANSPVQSFVAGDVITFVAAWEAGRTRLSINGGAFANTNGAGIPTLSATLFNIGVEEGGTAQHINSDVFWFACGTGTLTDADAAAIHAFGNTDPTLSTEQAIARGYGTLDTIPGSPTMLWPADTTTYYTADTTTAAGGDYPAARQHIVGVTYPDPPTPTPGGQRVVLPGLHP